MPCDAPLRQRHLSARRESDALQGDKTSLQSVAYIYLGANATMEDILNRTYDGDAVFSTATCDFIQQTIATEILATWL